MTEQPRKDLADWFERNVAGDFPESWDVLTALRAGAVGTAEPFTLASLVAAWDAWVEASAGRGHDGSHDTEMARILADPDAKPREMWSTVDAQRACAACAGAEYGAYSDLDDAMEAARRLVHAGGTR